MILSAIRKQIIAQTAFETDVLHHITVLKDAGEAVLDGASKKEDIDECLDICFALRTKPDIPSYVRAHANLTVCNTVPLRVCPVKIDLAAEALNIAKNLMNNDPLKDDPYWAARFRELLKGAESNSERVANEGQNLARAETVEEDRIGEDLPKNATADLQLEEKVAEQKDKDVKDDKPGDLMNEATFPEPADSLNVSVRGSNTDTKHKKGDKASEIAEDENPNLDLLAPSTPEPTSKN